MKHTFSGRPKTDVPSDFGRIEIRLSSGERPYLWLGIDGVCVDTFEGVNLRALKRAVDKLVNQGEQ